MLHLFTTLLLLVASPSRPQSQADTPGASQHSFTAASSNLDARLEASVLELDELRKEIAEGKLPLARRLRELETELTQARSEQLEAQRLLDGRTQDLSNLTLEIKARKAEADYLSSLFTEYARNFESRLHIAELKRYEEPLEAAKLAPDNPTLSQEQVFQVQAALLDVSVGRLFDALAGARFDGTAVDPDGRVHRGSFLLLGPSAIFRSEDGEAVGSAEQRLGSLEPTQVPFGRAEDSLAVGQLLSTGAGEFPLDPSLGNAHKIEATEESLLEHIRKGGTVMIPIFTLAGAALLVALYKWIVLTAQRKPSSKRVAEFLAAVSRNEHAAARELARQVNGPVGGMLVLGVEHHGEPPELIEEVLYEEVLKTKLKLQSLLPFVAISAASAPLLGLLGTVIGIINTFKLITVFGSGDVKSLSSGISEALITTEFGLIVAIPSLLLHSFLFRKAKGLTDQMEKTAVSFLNTIKRATPTRPLVNLPAAPSTGREAPDPSLVREQVNQILRSLLDPLVGDARVSPPVEPSSL